MMSQELKSIKRTAIVLVATLIIFCITVSYLLLKSFGLGSAFSDHSGLLIEAKTSGVPIEASDLTFDFEKRSKERVRFSSAVYKFRGEHYKEIDRLTNAIKARKPYDGNAIDSILKKYESTNVLDQYVTLYHPASYFTSNFVAEYLAQDISDIRRAKATESFRRGAFKSAYSELEKLKEIAEKIDQVEGGIDWKNVSRAPKSYLDRTVLSSAVILQGQPIEIERLERWWLKNRLEVDKPESFLPYLEADFFSVFVLCRSIDAFEGLRNILKGMRDGIPDYTKLPKGVPNYRKIRMSGVPTKVVDKSNFITTLKIVTAFYRDLNNKVSLETALQNYTRTVNQLPSNLGSAIPALCLPNASYIVSSCRSEQVRRDQTSLIFDLLIRKPEMLLRSGRQEFNLKDPWGNPYCMKTRGKEFLLWSNGPNGREEYASTGKRGDDRIFFTPGWTQKQPSAPGTP